MENGKSILVIFLAVDVTKILQATLWQWVWLAGLLVVLVVIVVWIRGWLHEDDDPSNVDHQMLREIAELQRRGELSSQEFRSIKGRLVERLNADEQPSETDRARSAKPETPTD